MAIKKNENDKYDVDVSYLKLNGKYGRKRKKDITKLKDAKLIEAEFIAIYKDGEIRDLKLKDVIDQFIDYKKVRVKETHIIKTRTLMNLCNDLWSHNIESINANHMVKLQKKLFEDNLSPTYINECLGRLYSIFEFSKTFNNTSNNPCERIERLKNDRKKSITFWTFEEYQKFENVIDDFEYKVFFNFLYFTGIRKGEAQALNWNDLDIKNEFVNIDKSLTFRTGESLYKITTPKTESSNRKISLPKKTLKLLKELKQIKKTRGHFSERHFIFGYPDTPLHDSTLTRRKNKYCALADVKQIKIHDFRHSHASLLINNNINILVVCKRLGHADVKMTLNTYSHMFKSAEDDAVNLLNEIY